MSTRARRSPVRGDGGRPRRRPDRPRAGPERPLRPGAPAESPAACRRRPQCRHACSVPRAPARRPARARTPRASHQRGPARHARAALPTRWRGDTSSAPRPSSARRACSAWPLAAAAGSAWSPPRAERQARLGRPPRRRRCALRRTGCRCTPTSPSRTLELRRGGRTVRRVTVAVGRPGSPTPTGRFAVTDKLAAAATAPTTAAASSRSTATRRTCRPAGRAATASPSTARTRRPRSAPPRRPAACAPRTPISRP